MKKSDTEQEQPGLEENKVPDSQSSGSLTENYRNWQRRNTRKRYITKNDGARDMSAI